MKCFKYMLAFAAAALCACGGGSDPVDGGGDIDVPTGGNDVVDFTKGKPRYIWVDAAANFPDFANSKDNIRRDLQLALDNGFTDIVVDVRSTNGDPLYITDKEQQTTELWAWVENAAGGYSQQKIRRTATWDYLQAFIDICRELGLRVHAGFNVFTAGQITQGEGSGLLFRDADKAATWATWVNTADGIKNIMELPKETCKFLNPANPEVQDYLCGLLADLAKYDLDGIVLDRGRYMDLTTDFSDISRKQFEAYNGNIAVKNWPDEVLPLGENDIPTPTPKYIKLWLEYRASVIYGFMQKARSAVKGVNPKIKFGPYVGAWYGSYYPVGVNWASQKYDPSTTPGYSKWATPNYRKYGYAALMDHILLGAYASPLHVYGSTEWTIEGFCKLGYDKICGDCPLVVGGPDVGNWNLTGATISDELNAVRGSVDAAMRSCDGYFLFDIIHLKIEPRKWTYVKLGISNYVKTVK